MATYQIKVINSSSEPQQYLLFSQAPNVSTEVGKAWSNVWVVSPTVDNSTRHAYATFNIVADDFAVCGTTDEALGDGVSVTTADYATVTLATNKILGTEPIMQVIDGGPGFALPFVTTSLGGSFGIKTKSWDVTRYSESIK
jgi:hypothetical protein